MSKPSRFTRIKITAGYLILLSFIFFSLFFIRREMQNLSVLDTEQLLRTDSLMVLLQEKDRNTINMIRTLNEANEQLLSIDEIQEIIALYDTVITQQRVQHRMITTRDSVITPSPKKNFFKRLSEAFVPSKDSTRMVNITQELMTDTLLHEYNPGDSIQERIREVSEQRLESHRITVRRNNARLRAMNNQLTARIDSLIREYQEEIILQATQEAENQQEIRHRSTLIIGGIAIGAVLLSAVFLFIILRDITQSNRYRRELEIANKRAEELLQARENLMLTITHDFKAPLSSIIGYLNLLSLSEPDKEQIKEYLENMKSSSDHLLKLVTDLLDFHRLDLNKTEINRETFNPAQLFDDIKFSFEPLTRNKRLSFEYEVDPLLHNLYISDPHRIRQIVNNLLSNAIKFTPSGGITLAVGYASSRLSITITDTGKGMDSDEKKRIFQEFTRLSGAQGQEGFGLGLSIVKKLVQLLEGNIEVDSIPGKGSTFTVHLPLYPVTGSRKNEKEQLATLQSATEIPPLNILLIDDDKIQLELTSAMLNHAGIKAVCCEQIDQLIEYLRYKTFDVLLTDVQMPAMNGFNLLKLLRASNIPQAQTIPVIAVTARSQMNGEEYKSYGFAGYLNKPFTINELLNIICGEQSIKTTVNQQTTYTSEPDFSALTMYAAGDEEKEKEIMKNFITETNKNIEYLVKAVQDKDIDNIAFIAHKLIPLLKLIGAKETIVIFQRLELLGGQEFNKSIIGDTEKAVEQIQKILSAATS